MYVPGGAVMDQQLTSKKAHLALASVDSVRFGSRTQEHSDSDTRRWRDPAQRCSLQDRKLDKADFQGIQLFRGLALGKADSALQSQRQHEGQIVLLSRV